MSHWQSVRWVWSSERSPCSVEEHRGRAGMRRAASTAAVAAVLMLLALPALGHATLIRTDPGDGVALEQAPEVIRLEFDEPVAVTATSIRVYNAAGARVDLGDTGHGVSSSEVTV